MTTEKAATIEKANDYLELCITAQKMRFRWIDAKNKAYVSKDAADERIETYYQIENRVEKRINYLLKTAFTL
jgi:hypothetical protein